MDGLLSKADQLQKELELNRGESELVKAANAQLIGNIDSLQASLSKQKDFYEEKLQQMSSSLQSLGADLN